LSVTDQINDTQVVTNTTTSPAHPTTNQKTETNFVINNITCDPASVTTTTNTIESRSISDASKDATTTQTEVQAAIKTTKLHTVTNVATFQSDRITNTVYTNATETSKIYSNINNVTSDSVTSDVTNVPKSNIVNGYFSRNYIIAGGAVFVVFILIVIYFAFRRSNKKLKRKIELNKRRKESKNVVEMEMGVYEEFIKVYNEKSPSNIEDAGCVENVNEATVV